MPRSSRQPVAGQDYHVLPNGTVVVKRYFHNLLEEYRQEPVPDYLALVDHKAMRIESKKKYRKALCREEMKFNALVRLLKDARLAVILAFQGWNAAGKSGAITRLFEAVWRDNRIFAWIPIGAPTGEELAGDFLERFHRDRRMPQYGQVHCFDRSWHERLMIEKVEKLTSSKDIQQSYAQIRSFEQNRDSLGHIVIKIWMDITAGEQWKRFQQRESEKPDKLTDADRKERKQRHKYCAAINEMFHRTGTQYAPWHIVSSQDKKYSRVAVLQIANSIMLARLQEVLGEEELAARLAARLAYVLKEKRLFKLLVATMGEILDKPSLRKLAGRIVARLDDNEELSRKLDKGKLRRMLDSL